MTGFGGSIRWTFLSDRVGNGIPQATHRLFSGAPIYFISDARYRSGVGTAIAIFTPPLPAPHLRLNPSSMNSFDIDHSMQNNTQSVY
jgi:hypothetical protein